MIKFSDLFMACLDISGKDEVSIIVDGGFPDRMFAKSAAVIYGDYYVVWFSGNTFGISKDGDI